MKRDKSVCVLGACLQMISDDVINRLVANAEIEIKTKRDAVFHKPLKEELS